MNRRHRYWMVAILLVALLSITPSVAWAQQAQQQGQGQEQSQAQSVTIVPTQSQGQLQGQSQGQEASQGNVQSITTQSVPNMIQLPGFNPAYPNFTQPYKPDAFVNGAGAVRPIKMTAEQASKCASGLGYWGVNDDWIGDSGSAATEITLYYPAWDKVQPVNTMDGFLGTSQVTAKDKPWLNTLCSAAKIAMEHGATVGVVEYVIRPVNKTAGIGFGSSGGVSAIPSGGANPYALAGILGFGMGVSNAYVQGELMLQVTGLTKPVLKSARTEPVIKPAALRLDEDGTSFVSNFGRRPEVMQSH